VADPAPKMMLAAAGTAESRAWRVVEGTAAPAPAGIVSVIVPVAGEAPQIEAAHHAYKAALSSAGWPLEFVYVLERRAGATLATLARLKEAGEPLHMVVPSRWDGEAPALRLGLQHAKGDIVLTLPPHLQVEPADLPAMLAALGAHDMAVGRRRLPSCSLGTVVFHWLIRRLFGHPFRDLVCRVRACRRQVLEEIGSYGMQPHFLPLLASERGFRLCEVELRASPGAAPGGRFQRPRPLSRLRLVLDVLAFYVITRFLRKPLHFFGAIGLPILAGGLLFSAWLAIERLFLGEALADRPALILGVLMIVLGIQIIALGLIGEIIIFASGRRIKDYTVERIL